MSEQAAVALALAIEMLRKSGVREWEDEKVRLAIADAAVQMAEIIIEFSDQNKK